MSKQFDDFWRSAEKYANAAGDVKTDRIYGSAQAGAIITHDGLAAILARLDDIDARITAIRSTIRHGDCLQ